MIRNFEDKIPIIKKPVYIDETAVIIGEVLINTGVSLWPNVVVRADVAEVTIGENTNIQDGTLIHTNYEMPVIIGEDVTVGHGVIIHGCTIGDRVLVGMGAILLDECVVNSDNIIAAGSVVPEGKVLDSGYLYMGIPAVKKRSLKEEEMELIRKRAEEYTEFAERYSHMQDQDAG